MAAGTVGAKDAKAKRLRCLYCAQRATAAKDKGLSAPAVSVTSYVCNLCVRPIKFGCTSELPLCIMARPGLESCFVLYHQQKSSLSLANADASAASSLAMDEESDL